MKYWISIISLTFFFIIMLCFPNIVFIGAADGLLLWFDTVLPTLFPFLVITGLMIETNTVVWITRFLAPLICPFFRISSYGSFVLLCGFFCGYPMGAKIASDMTTSGYLSREEGEYLLSFCNNTSPMFMISYLFVQNLRCPDLALISLFILYGSAITCGLFFRTFTHFQYKRVSTHNIPPCKTTTISFPQILDNTIYNSCESITKIGGYIIIFSILSSLLRELPITGSFWNTVLLPSIEITGGIRLLCTHPISFSVRYVCLMALASFGGFCAIFQTQCMVQKNAFSLIRYIIEKLITTMVTSFISYLFILFYSG